MESVEPRRSNCGPPSPSPKRGAFPVKKLRAPEARSQVSVWTVSSAAVATVKVRGAGETLSIKFPSLTVCAEVPPRSLAIGGSHAVLTRHPLSGTGSTWPFLTRRTLKRAVCSLTEESWTSKSFVPASPGDRFPASVFRGSIHTAEAAANRSNTCRRVHWSFIALTVESQERKPAVEVCRSQAN